MVLAIAVSKYIVSVTNLHVMPLVFVVYGALILLFLLIEAITGEHIKGIATRAMKKLQGTRTERSGTVNSLVDLAIKMNRGNYLYDSENGKLEKTCVDDRIVKLMVFYMFEYREIKDDKDYEDEVHEIDKMAVELEKLFEESMEKVGYITQNGLDIVKEFAVVMEEKIEDRGKKLISERGKEYDESLQSTEEHARKILNCYKDI